jgi:hypothetical protein
MKFFGRSGSKNSYVEGSGFASDGSKIYDISGSWLSGVQVTDLRSGEAETVWEQP